MAASETAISAMADMGLGMGDMVEAQRRKQIEEEQRKKRLGLSSIGGNPLNFGMSGVAAVDLGYSGAGRR